MTTTPFRNGHSYRFSKRFAFDQQGRPMVALSVIDRNQTPREFAMLADTGADGTLMPEHEAPKLGIPDITLGYIRKRDFGTAGLGKITAYFHRLLATVPGSAVWFPLLIGFSPDLRSRLFGRADMLREFVLAFDSRATYFLRG